MTEYRVAAVFDLFLLLVAVLTPLAGATLAAVLLPKRGRRARLALAGCLVSLLNILVTHGLMLATGPLMKVFGIALAHTVISAVSMPIHIIGFGLLLAGALTGPPQTPAPAPAPALAPPSAPASPSALASAPNAAPTQAPTPTSGTGEK
ncbi:hypothetical protein AB0M43_12990 [Longispora sp. NPDC051575]|uniref:hypothetical protein n=1 Tax=Longispora sp. NPDC051575 TaxID=3154943 RepID=UPI0034331EBC